MLEMELEKSNAGGVSSIKAHDTKRFRLRAVSQESDIYQRYYSGISKNISITQLVLAGCIIFFRFVVTIVMNMQGTLRSMAYSDVFNQGTSWIATTLSALAALVALMSTKKPTYIKLHTAMALHIITVFILSFSSIMVYYTELRGLKDNIRSLNSGDYYVFDKDGYYPDFNHPSASSTTPTPGVYYDRPHKIVGTVEEALEIVSLNKTAYIITAAMFSGMFMQIILSIVMTFQTGRAICCGRTHLEGKFLEMEAVGSEDPDAIVNFRVGHRRASTVSLRNQPLPQQHQTQSHQDPPPSYAPELFAPTPSSIMEENKEN